MQMKEKMNEPGLIRTFICTLIISCKLINSTLQSFTRGTRPLEPHVSVHTHNAMWTLHFSALYTHKYYKNPNKQTNNVKNKTYKLLNEMVSDIVYMYL